MSQMEDDIIVFWRRHADCHVLVTDVSAVTQLKLCFCATIVFFFDINNDKYYCSELIYESFKHAKSGRYGGTIALHTKSSHPDFKSEDEKFEHKIEKDITKTVQKKLKDLMRKEKRQKRQPTQC